MKITPYPQGANLDAEAIRQEIYDRAENGEMSEEHADLIDSLSDELLNGAAHAVMNDYFWEVFDNFRSDAINLILERYSNK